MRAPFPPGFQPDSTQRFTCGRRGPRDLATWRPRGRSEAAQVAKEISEIKGVQQAEDVTGPYDVIVRAEARNVDDLGKLVVARVQAVDGITRTLTCPVVHL